MAIKVLNLGGLANNNQIIVMTFKKILWKFFDSQKKKVVGGAAFALNSPKQQNYAFVSEGIRKEAKDLGLSKTTTGLRN